jgi:hypothetical protein
VNPPPTPVNSRSSTSCAEQAAEVAAGRVTATCAGSSGSLVLTPARWPALLALAYVISLPVAVAASGGDFRLLRGILAVVATAPALACLRRDLLRRGVGAVRVLRWDAGGGFHLDLAGGRRVPACLAHGSFGTTGCLWLVFRGAERHTVFIDRAATDPAAYAALRRLLRRLPAHGEGTR